MLELITREFDYKELGTNLNARILQIGIGKGDRLMEVIGI